LAREAARQAKEREKVEQAAHVVAQLKLAEQKSATVAEEIDVLDQVLVGVLRRPPLTFDRLKIGPRVFAFDPGGLGVPVPLPDRGKFARRGRCRVHGPI
jgi:hypothetical protein